MYVCLETQRKMDFEYARNKSHTLTLKGTSLPTEAHLL